MGGSDDSIGSGHMPKSSSYCSFYEERDDDGEVVQVGDLKFIDKILGSGSYATVVLAKRERKKCSKAVKSPREQGSFPSGGSFSPKISPCCKTSMSVAEVTTPSGPFSSSSGEELVAVKIFSKSVLKRVRNIKRTESNKSSKHDRQTSGGVQIEIHTALENVEREIALMKMFRHPNVVSLLQVIDCVESDALYVVLEYVPLGEIMTFDPDTIRFRHRHHNTPGLTKDGYFDEETAALFFVDVLHGLAYLHRNYISHLDLKPENILLSENGVAKISDFGNSYFFEEEKKAKRSEHSYGYDEMSDVQDSIHGCTTSKLTRYDTDSALEMNRMNSSGILKNTEGTIPFWSPEMCNGAKSFSGYASDVWAAGVCLYVFASGRLPFYSDVPSDLCHLISQANITFKDTSFSEKLKELLSRILQKDPCQRVGLGEILSHDFCKKARIDRIRMLGIRDSEAEIVIKDEGTKRAFSIARLAKKVRDKVSRRFQNIASAFNSGNEAIATG